MDKKQFIAKFKDIYHHTKRSEHDSSWGDVRDAFLQDIISKSNGGWDESIAQETMRFIEHAFRVQPVETQQAQLMTSEDSEAVLGQFLRDRGYTYTHIPESGERSPDGYIEHQADKYLCELKSPVLMFDHAEAPFGYKFSTTQSKILNAIHAAKAQLETLDSYHSLPHVLVYTSALPQLDYHSFINAIRGYVANQDGTITTDLRETAIFKSTKSMIKSIDLYMWLRVSSKGALRVSYFDNQDSKHKKLIDRLVHNLRNKPVSSMDMHASVQDILGGAV